MAEAVIFSLDDDLIVTAPVTFSVPKSTGAGSRATEPGFIKRTIYLDFRVPVEEELEALNSENLTHNTEIARKLGDLAKREAALLDEADAAEARTALDTERIKLVADKRDWQTEMIVRHVVGFPAGHGIGMQGGLAEFDTATVRRLCEYRFIRQAIYDVLMRLIAGEAKKGN